MHIQVSKGTGTGLTELAAFDQALVNAGIANFNLIYLSSVLPAGSKVEYKAKPTPPKGDWGDRLYLVRAEMRTSVRNDEAWAGIGWIQDSKDGKGLLVEHEGHSEVTVKRDIENSLKSLASNRNMKFGPVHMQVTGIQCKDQPVCALVVAVFESSSWKAKRTSLHKFISPTNKLF